MSKYIDAEKLCEFARNHINKSVDCNDIMRFPTADLQEVRNGKWVYCGRHHDFLGHVFECSVCGRYLFSYSKEDVYLKYPYCHCGAKMDEEEEK